MRIAASWLGPWTNRIQGCGAIDSRPRAGSPLIVIPDRTKRAVVLEAVKVWPGKAGSCRKVGATANLDRSCARRRERSAGRDEETGFQIEQRNDKKERCGALKLLDKKAHTRVTQRQRGRHGVGQCYSTCNFRGLPGASCIARCRRPRRFTNISARPAARSTASHRKRAASSGPDDRDQGALSR